MTERLLDKFLESDSMKQAELLAMLTPEERHALLVILDAELDNPWARWQNDPVGFVEQGLGETLWSKQKEILTSLTQKNSSSCLSRAWEISFSRESGSVVVIYTSRRYSSCNYNSDHTSTGEKHYVAAY